MAGEGERPQAWSPPTVPHSGREGHPQLGTREKCTEMPTESQKQFKDPRTGMGGISKGSETPTFTPARPGLVWPGVSGWLLPSVSPCSDCSGVRPELCLPFPISWEPGSGRRARLAVHPRIASPSSLLAGDLLLAGGHQVVEGHAGDAGSGRRRGRRFQGAWLDRGSGRPKPTGEAGFLPPAARMGMDAGCRIQDAGGRQEWRGDGLDHARGPAQATPLRPRPQRRASTHWPCSTPATPP